MRISPAFLGEFAGPIMQMTLTTVFIVALIIWDVRSERRVHPVTLWAGIPLLLSQPLRIAVANTDAWRAIGSALIDVA